MSRLFLDISQFFLIAALIGVFFVAAEAVTLPKYRENIAHLKGAVDALLYPDDDITDAEKIRVNREILNEFPKMLPSKDRVEWQGAIYEINNQWLENPLRQLEKESLDSPKRQALLIELRERLAAIETKLEEFENQTASTNSKDADKRKLSEILRREEFQKPEDQKQTALEKLYAQIINWFARMFPRPNFSDASASGLQSFSFALQMLLYALILVAIGFLIYRFAPFLMNKYRYKEKRQPKERVVLGERLAAHETARNLFDEAETLARAGNLRGAIRKGYIAFLCDLSDKKVIGLSSHKTNRDYLRDVRPKPNLHKNMNNLTNVYERHWYGSENAEHQDWEEFKNGYEQAVSLNN